MVDIAGYSVETEYLVIGVLVVLGLGYIGVWQGTPNPSAPTDPVDFTNRLEVATGLATVATGDEADVTFETASIEPAGTTFGTFDPGSGEITSGETADYCADVSFESSADYTYVGTYLSTSDFDFPQEGDVEWSDYHSAGSTVEICMPFDAPGAGTYDQSMWCDFNSPGCEDRVDEDTFTVVGETDNPPEIEDMNCPATAGVGESVNIDPDIDEDTGISRYYWDGDDIYSTSSEITTSWDSTGDKNVELTVTDQAEQTDSDSCTVSVESGGSEPSGDVEGNTVLDFLGSAAAVLS